MKEWKFYNDCTVLSSPSSSSLCNDGKGRRDPAQSDAQAPLALSVPTPPPTLAGWLSASLLPTLWLHYICQITAVPSRSIASSSSSSEYCLWGLIKTKLWYSCQNFISFSHLPCWMIRARYNAVQLKFYPGWTRDLFCSYKEFPRDWRYPRHIHIVGWE